jgi:putative cardiolipin synthase
LRRPLRALAATAAVAVFLAGCAATPAPPPTAKPSSARAPAPGGALADAEASIRATHGPEVSGFLPLERNADALAWRLALIDAARDSIDLQYYVWFGDRVGQAMLARTLAAAERGVRVRLLVDDLNTVLRDMTTVEVRDALHATLDRHPNIEVRVFNGWHGRGLVERAAEGVAEFTRLNRRMHNKQLVVDNRAAIIGGRNIADEYFGLNPTFNFHDLDVLGVGPVARDASRVFDRYWNSGWAGRLPPPAGSSPPGSSSPPAEPSVAAARAIAALGAEPLPVGPARAGAPRPPEVGRLASLTHPGRGRVHADPPSRDAATRNRMPETFRALLRSARTEVLIVNAYIIPDDTFVADLGELNARGVAVRILTNSLSSHDVPAVNSHYERWRPAILATGAVLHELRADPAIQATVVDTSPVRSRFTGLHVKAMVVDRERAFVGSMNLDPRSEVFNAEMGVVVDGAPLARALAASMERDLSGANSWRVEAGPDGALRWTSDAGTLERQPARSAWQRVENVFFKLFPPSLY